jgi:general secretion pathway protein K
MSRSPGNPAKQRGIAALTAMLVVTIATILAVELVWDLNLDLRRTESLLTREQAMQVALGMELLAEQLLEADYEDDPQIDSLTEAWAEQYDFPFEGGTVSGKLEDLQGRFNLNNLIDLNGRRNPKVTDQFRRLVSITTQDIPREDQVNVDTVVESVLDWLDPDQLPELGGAEDSFYTALDPPYRTGNFWFTSISELQAVNGVTPAAYQALASAVAALPPVASGARSINLNTAREAVLRSLSDEVTEIQTADWVAQQQSAPYDNLDEFMEGAKDVLDEEVRPYLGITSSYFRLSVIVSIGTTRLAMYSLLERNAQGVVAARYRSFDTE